MVAAVCAFALPLRRRCSARSRRARMSARCLRHHARECRWCRLWCLPAALRLHFASDSVTGSAPAIVARTRSDRKMMRSLFIYATVSRTTSSSVVTPLRILARPDSRKETMPSSMARLRSSSADAPIRINSRISSVTSITS